LKNFIHGNAFESGNQWRCRVCERFLSWQELEVCGFTAKLLKEFAQEAVSLDRDRIELNSNGTYRLLDERQSNRQKNKRQRESDDVSVNKGASKKTKPNETEVIDLID
jgi:hypothetical protein